MRYGDKTVIATIDIRSKKFHEYHICVLDVLTVNAYQKIAKIAHRQVSVQIVVGNNVAAGILLTDQQQLISTHRTHFSFSDSFISVSFSAKYSLISLMLNSFRHSTWRSTLSLCV